MNGEGDERRAFVVTRQGDRTWVTDLRADGKPQIIGSSADAIVQLDDSVEDEQLSLTWDGTTLTLTAQHDGTFLAGKRFVGSQELKPGDELACGNAQLVVGISLPLGGSGGRRALTHHEFRERLYEEIARANRGGRPTALIMVAAKAGEGGRLAAAALEEFRAGDVVATYATDEPEMLLPDTDLATARMVLTRMLKNAGLEATVGLAVSPEHGDSPERLLSAARRALDAAIREGSGIHEPPPRSPDRAVPLTAQDTSTREAVAQLEDAAADSEPLLLQGEKSSGKSVFARVVHERGARAAKPFVILRCAALEKAPGDKELSRAIGGTLVLDEIGDLESSHQRALLEWISAEHDVRLIATTHRALAGLVERGAFEKGLHEFFVGRVVEIPALRNRPEDIIPLAESFAKSAGDVRLSPGALARLRSYPWPGNVLELRNAMERAVRLARDGEILAEHLPSEPMPLANTSGEGRLREHVDSVERDAIIKALADCNRNQTHAAKRLGISRRALIYKMEKYGLKRPPKGSRR